MFFSRKHRKVFCVDTEGPRFLKIPSHAIKQSTIKQFSYATFRHFSAVHYRQLKVNLDIGEKVVCRIFMAFAIHERRIRIHRNQFFLVDVCEARVMWNEIRVLFVVDSLNFPSRLDACACRLEFRTRKSIRLLKENEKQEKKVIEFHFMAFFLVVDLRQMYLASEASTLIPCCICLL